MSGGVDSSVAAALLQKKGFEVIGIFMKFWSEAMVGRNNSQAEERAKQVASILNIPFYVLSAKKIFKKEVVDYFLQEYQQSRTPNPCVVCNKKIKFGVLLKRVLTLKYDYIATGHYVRLRREIPKQHYGQSPLAKAKLQIPNYKLFRGKDKTKDQSYFLWQLTQKELAKLLFPLGDYTKTEVKKLAEKLKLPIIGIFESQGICFIQTTINDFLSRYLRPDPGIIVDKAGRAIGQHQGLAFYTIGQRKGVGVSGGPYYVLKKDIKKNLLIVTKQLRDLNRKEFSVKKVNWLSSEKFDMSLKVKAQIRYRHPAKSAIIQIKKNSRNKVVFVTPQRAITSGQSVVFYRGQELLGGGVII